MTQNQPQHHSDDSQPHGEPKDELQDEGPSQDPREPDLEMPDAGGGEAAPGGDESQLTTIEAELAETKDRMLRAMADVENTRRRAAREQEEARKYAMTGFARELLEVADNLGRALDAVPGDVRESEQVKPLVEGIELTQRSLATCFERHKITKVAPLAGDRFDHNQHQAMFEVETADHAPGAVVQVMQAGYVIADRLLRPALVGVAKRPADAAPPPADGDEAGGQGQRLDTNI